RSLQQCALRQEVRVMTEQQVQTRWNAVQCRRHGLLPLPKGEGWGEGLQRIEGSDPPHPNPLPSRSRMFPTSATSLSDRTRVDPSSVGERESRCARGETVYPNMRSNQMSKCRSSFRNMLNAPTRRPLLTRTLIAASLAALAAGCSPLDRLRGVGEQPTLSQINNPTTQVGYKPVQMPMPAPQPASYNPNS